MPLKTTITRRVEWDMGHRIPDHESLCRNPHGHRYVAEVTIEGEVSNEQGSPKRGMVEDFGRLKILLSFIQQYDHSFMVYEHDPFAEHLSKFELEEMGKTYKPTRIHYVGFIPTAENIAKFIFEGCLGRGANVVEVTVWETPNCKATVTNLVLGKV